LQLLVVAAIMSSFIASFIAFFITRDIVRICHANSVCSSVKRVYCIKTAQRIIEILSPSDRPIILVFSAPRVVAYDGFTPSGGAKYKGVAMFDQYAAISRKGY